MSATDTTEHLTATWWGGEPHRLVSMQHLIDAGIEVNDLPAGRAPQHVYVAANPKIAEAIEQRLTARGKPAPHWQLIVWDIVITDHGAG